MPVGKADPEVNNEPFEHPDSPNSGSFWQRNVISFSKLKITNNKESKTKNVNDAFFSCAHMYIHLLVYEILIND